jgi:vacuolar protein sorting-associated protein 13D
VSMMIYEGSVGALVKNVAHGLSNSAAKVTGTLGEGLGRTILDDKHEEGRRRIKEDHAGSSGGYLYAGLKGFGYGIVGGMTSVIAQSYEGVSNDGITVRLYESINFIFL